MYKTVESNESMRSEDSEDLRSRYRNKRRFDETETESCTVLPWKKNCKKNQKDASSSMHNSGTRLNWCSSDHKWSPRRLIAQRMSPSQSHEKKAQKNVQVGGPSRFNEIHRSMNPNSSNPAARITLANQSESKSQGCAICLRKKSNEGTRKRNRQCFRFCRRKKKKLNEEEQRLLKETNLSSVFVPLQKSAGTNPIKVDTLNNNNLPEYYHKSARKEDNSFTHESQEARISNAPRHSNKIKAPSTPVERVTFKSESTQTTVSQQPVHGEKKQKFDSETIVSQQPVHGEKKQKFDSEAIVSQQPMHGEKKQKFNSDMLTSYDGSEKPANITKSCCYLCVQNTIAITATTSKKIEQCNKSVQTYVDSYCNVTTTYDKSCNPTPCVRTVKSSVKINTYDNSTQTNGNLPTINRAKCKKTSSPLMVECPTYSVKQTMMNNGIEKCRKCSTKPKCRTKKKH